MFRLTHGLYFGTGYAEPVCTSQIDISIFRIKQETGEAFIRQALLVGIHCSPVDDPKSVSGGNPDMFFYRGHRQNLVIAEIAERDTLLTRVFGIDTHHSSVKSYPKHAVFIP